MDVSSRKVTLTLDQQRVLDEVAGLALRGYDARPSYLAHVLNMPLVRVQAAVDDLCRIGLVLSQDGRAPRC